MDDLDGFEALYRELSDMRGELASFFEELEFVNRVLIPRTQVSYLIKVGALRVELLQAQINVMKTRRRIAILRSNIDNGDATFDDAIKDKIDAEFTDWDSRLTHETSQIERAKARFSSLAPTEDEDEVREIFRTLCRKFNPEINPDQSEEAKSFWPSVYSAYTGGDLYYLKALLLMSEDYPESYDLPCNVGAMRENRSVLKEKIRRARSQLRNATTHPAFEWLALLRDRVRLSAEQNRLRNEIAGMKTQQVALLDMQKSLELRDSRR